VAVVAIRWPSGLNATPRTSRIDVRRSTGWRAAPVCQTRAAPSLCPLTSRRPSVLNAMLQAAPPWPSSTTGAACPVGRDIRTVPSSPPLAIR
jgi:hypothetical protein